MDINQLIERFLRDSGLPPARFGRMAVNDPRLVFDMRLGRQLGPEIQHRLRQFMLDHPASKRGAA